MKLKRIALSLVLAVSLLTPAFAADKPANDDYISDSVRQKLAADQVVKGGAIEVIVKDGVVTLTGKVQEPRQRSKAESLAKRVHGVKTVVNNLTIDKP
ncbi:MAG: BON domain-containing protein [Bryobacteraceae bacterium]|jgi:osmotically-inducible protein OsmY